MTDPTVRWAKAIRLAIVLATGLSLSIVSRVDAGSTNCQNPGAFWCEDWETAVINPDGTIQGYDKTVNSNMRVSTANPHTGTKALELFYPANVDSGPGFMYWHFGSISKAPVQSLYMRWYQKWSANWTLGTGGNQGSKGIIFLANPRPTFYFEHLFNNLALLVQAQVVKETAVPWDSENFYQNQTSLAFENNRWYCIEGHVALNDPGVANGTVELWIDGVQHMNYTGREFKGASTSDPAPPTALFDKIMFSGSKNPQLTDQFTWYDDIVLSTQRIGCAGGSGLQAPSTLTLK